MSNDGLGDEVQRDVEKYRKLQSVKLRGGDLTVKLEYACWALAVLAVGGMLVSMYFAGPGKPLTGMAWLGGSLVTIVTFGGLAIVFRRIPEVEL